MSGAYNQPVNTERIMFGLGIPELLIILAIALLLFGTKRLKSLGSDLGGAIKGFRKAVSDEDAKLDAEAEKKLADERVIDGEASKVEGSKTTPNA